MSPDSATRGARARKRRTKIEPGREGYIYIVGELEEPTGPVKIGMTYAAQSKAGRAGLSEGNWRTLYAEHTRIVPWPELRWFEWRIHQALMPWHKRGEWFDVRPLKDELGGWDELLDAAIEGSVRGADSWTVGDDAHHLVTVNRHWPAKPMRFSAQCSCGEEIQGPPGRAFISMVRQFEVEHLGTPKSTRRGGNRRPKPRPDVTPPTARSRDADQGLGRAEMPHRSADWIDQPFDRSHHRPGTSGDRNECTVRNCPEPPVVSRQWFPPDRPDGWWAAYCAHHAEERLRRAR